MVETIPEEVILRVVEVIHHLALQVLAHVHQAPHLAAVLLEAAAAGVLAVVEAAADGK